MEWIILVALVLVFLLLLSTYGAVENLRRAQEGLRTDLWRLEQGSTDIPQKPADVRASLGPDWGLWASERLANSGNREWGRAAEDAMEWAEADGPTVGYFWPDVNGPGLACDDCGRVFAPGEAFSLRQQEAVHIYPCKPERGRS